ncbi:MAG: glycosyltransferase [Alphaproteobacteria bacterium]
MPRVLTVMAGAPVGGAEAFFVTLTAAFARARAEVQAALRPNAMREAALRDGHVRFATFPFRRWTDFRTRSGLRSMAQQFRPDATLTFAGRASSMMPVGDYPIIGRLGGYYSMRNFRHCNHLVCNTPELEQYVIAHGWPKERVSIIPNFPNVEKSPAADRGLLGTPIDAPLALGMGRLHKNKAFDVLLRAAARIADLWVWIAGEGEEGPRLEALASALGISSRVKFLGWRTDRGALFRAANLCVVPSRVEPMGNVIVEAWAYGTPLVAADSSGPKWLVRDGEDGLLVPKEDDAALAAAIQSVFSLRPLAQRLRANGERRVEHEFSERHIVPQYFQLFEKLRRRT